MSRLEFAETVATGEVTAEVDVVGEGSLLHEEEECADGGIRKRVGGGGQKKEN